jgi:hypothetical protein
MGPFLYGEKGYGWVTAVMGLWGLFGGGENAVTLLALGPIWIVPPEAAIPSGKVPLVV